MHILHVIRDLDLGSGGPSRSVPNLARSLASRECSLTILFRDRGQPRVEGENCPGVSLQAIGSRPIYSARSRAYSTLDKVRCDRPINVVHLHGLWDPLNQRAATFARRHGIPVVVSPRGMLEPWAMNHRRWRKSIAWRLYQRCQIRLADVIHVTGSNEVQSCVDLGFSNPICLIGNGTEIPSCQPSVSRNNEIRRLTFISRVHPKKGLRILTKALRNLADHPQRWTCDIYGPNEAGHQQTIEAEVRSLGLAGRIRFGGPVYGEEKWQRMRESDIFVLPSHSENFGIVVAESLACNTPVITTTATPWKDLVEHRCGWWVDDTVDGITKALTSALSESDATLREMGQRGRKLVEERYSWPRVANQMAETYRWVVDGGTRPETFV